jgi:hypothetical protein
LYVPTEILSTDNHMLCPFEVAEVLSHVLFKSEVHRRAYKRLPLVPDVSQENPIHIRSYFFKLRNNIILTSISRTFKRFFSFRLEKKKSLDVHTKLR